MSRTLRILVTGGGTGGHTVPALATIDAAKILLASSHPDIVPEILYVGSEAGLESRLAREAGLKFTAIATGKLRRSANPLRMLSAANIKDALRVPIGFIQAVKVVGDFKPDVVFSTGGYVSVPAVFAAGVLGRPVLMHEQTVQIGLANRWCARVASRIALSFAESADELSSTDREKTFVTGGVVRNIVLQGNATAGRARYGFNGELKDLPVIYITGGALGSSIINNSVLSALPELLAVCCIIHQCGKQGSQPVQDESRLIEAAAKLPDALRNRYRVSAFIGDEIGDVYAASSLVVGRSGAGTVSEVSAVGKAAIFVPLVPTGGDEQTKNARRLESIGAAEVIKQSELTGTSLVEHVSRLLSDNKRLKKMGEAAMLLASPFAAETLASAVIELGLGETKIMNDLSKN